MEDKKYNITIYYIGGTSSTLTEVNEVAKDDFIKWLDSRFIRNKTWKLNFFAKNKLSLIRKENITNVVIIPCEL